MRESFLGNEERDTKYVAQTTEDPFSRHLKLPTLVRLDVGRLLREPPPTVPWLVEGIVARGYLTVLHGLGGIGKSLFALQMCVDAARGRAFLGRTTGRCRVLYVDAENGEGEAHRRLHQLGADAELASWMDYVVADGHDLVRDSEELHRLVQECRPDLMVVDSLASVWSINEIDPTEMTRALGVLTRNADRNGVGIMALHHDKKDGTQYRGSGAVAAATQVVLHLHQSGGEGSQKLSLTRTKNRMGARDLNLCLQIVSSEGSLAIEAAEPEQSPLSKALEQQTLDLLSDGEERSTREIAEALGRSATDGSVARVVKDLKGTGTLEVGSNGKKVRLPTSDPAIHPLVDGSVDHGASHSRDLTPAVEDSGIDWGEDEVEWESA